jgi:hypothetical protein|tara:strand:- start:108 stop:602 length:495 start_codon:yes stop_codon:yes gene_type:complete
MTEATDPMVLVERQFARCQVVVKDTKLAEKSPLDHHLLLCQEVAKLVCAEHEHCSFHNQILDSQLAVDALTSCIAKLRESDNYAPEELQKAQEAMECAESVQQTSSHAWLLHIGTLAGMFSNGKKLEAESWDSLKRYFGNPELADSSKVCVQRMQELMARFGEV